MIIWLQWVLGITGASFLLPLLVGEIAILGGIFRKDPDAIAPTTSSSTQLADSPAFMSAADPEP